MLSSKLTHCHYLLGGPTFTTVWHSDTTINFWQQTICLFPCVYLLVFICIVKYTKFTCVYMCCQVHQVHLRLHVLSSAPGSTIKYPTMLVITQLLLFAQHLHSSTSHYTLTMLFLSLKCLVMEMRSDCSDMLKTSYFPYSREELTSGQ